MVSHTKQRLISVLIPDGEMYFAVKVMRCLSRMPAVKIHILSKTKKTVARLSRYCSSCHYHASGNDDDWINVIRSLVEKLQIDVVLPATDTGFEFMVRNHEAISEFAGVPCLPDEELFNMVSDKWSFYCFAKKNGLPIPSSLFIGNAGQPLPDSLDLDSIEFPALLKPTRLSGGFGIVEVMESSDLVYAWEDKNIIKGCQYFLQSYVPGDFLCLCQYCKEGKVLDYTLQKSLFIPEHYFGPMKAMDFLENVETVELGARLVSIMGWNGATNIDFILDDRNMNVVILDFNPRFGQSVLGSLTAGVNFPVRACLDAVGVDCPEMQQNYVRYAHPVSHAKMLAYRFLGRKTPVKIHWRDGGLSFVVRDPFPELFGFVQKIVGRLRKTRFNLHRKSSKAQVN
jgi:predicted ATP-grasp superfamily ATP-dependent carboligase